MDHRDGFSSSVAKDDMNTAQRKWLTGMWRVLAASIVLLCASAACVPAPDKTEKGAPESAAVSGAADSARRVIAEFYDWYVAVALAPSTAQRAWYRVLDESPSVLSDSLLRALQRNRELQRAAPGVIAGLESDPFLNSQDPCPGYSVASATQSGSTVVVVIEPKCGTDRQPQAHFKVMMTRNDSGWVVTDLEYPGEFGGSLMARLRQ